MQLLTKQQLAHLLNIKSVKTIDRWMSNGQIPRECIIRLGDGPRPLVRFHPVRIASHFDLDCADPSLCGPSRQQIRQAERELQRLLTT